MARMGPIRGEINILATSWTGEFSTRPENFVEKTKIYFNDKNTHEGDGCRSHQVGHKVEGKLSSGLNPVD